MAEPDLDPPTKPEILDTLGRFCRQFALTTSSEEVFNKFSNVEGCALHIFTEQMKPETATDI